MTMLKIILASATFCSLFTGDALASNPPIGWTLTHETFATTPANRQRTKVGVGEEVTLTAPCPADWTIQGGGKLSVATGVSTKFTAPDRAANVTITAKLHVDNSTKNITFNVIEPSGMTMQQKQGTGVKHTKDTVSAGFQAQPIILTPLDVSFYAIEIQEQAVNAVTTGFYDFWKGIPHAVGPWVSVKQNNELLTIDTIWSGDPNFNTPPNPNVAGTLIWDIPWHFRVAGGAGKQFLIAQHKQEVDNNGKCTISKGGVSVSKNLNDPTSNY